MGYSFDLRQEAVMELLDSVIWYDEQQEGLGKRFRSAFKLSLSKSVKTRIYIKKPIKIFTKH